MYSKNLGAFQNGLLLIFSAAAHIARRHDGRRVLLVCARLHFRNRPLFQGPFFEFLMRHPLDALRCGKFARVCQA